MIEAILGWTVVIALPEAVVGIVFYSVTQRHRLPSGALIFLAASALLSLTTVLYFVGVRYKLWAWPWLAFGIQGVLVTVASVRPESLSGRRRAAIRVARTVGVVCALAFPALWVWAHPQPVYTRQLHCVGAARTLGTNPAGRQGVAALGYLPLHCGSC